MVVSTNAVAPGAIVRPTSVVEASARAVRTLPRVPQVNVGGASARGPSVTCVAPDTASEPTVEMPTVSAVAPAVIASRCVTFDGRFPGTPSAATETEKDGLASAEDGARTTGRRRAPDGGAWRN